MTEGQIVVGVDGSNDARRATTWALSWAKAAGIPVSLIVAEPIPPGRTPDSPGLGEKAQATLDEEIAHFAGAADGVEVSGEVAISHPVTALVNASQSAGAVVVGTHGKGGWKGTLVGSVSGNVAAASHSPTVVLPTGAPGTYDPKGAIVVGYDGSEAASEAAALAIEAAAAEGRVVRLAQADTGVSSPDEPLENQVAELREANPGVEIELISERTQAVELLTDLSRDAAFVVVASAGHGGVPGFLLGSTTRALVQSAQCPVLVLTRRSEKLWPLATS